MTTDQWKIEVTVNPPKVNPVQREYLVACELANAGIPINVFDWRLSHGALMIEMLPDNKRLYTWIGEDRRQ